jgi:phosphoribosylformylglycinamidine synthase
VKGTDKALAMTVDCNSRYVHADPEQGTAIAVAEAARNITCSGGLPMGVTNCLNFGNPYKPEVYWQFVGAIKGMGAACREFNTPVTGGNVSFYNQSNFDGEIIPVFPTPTIGMLGVIDNKEHRMSLNFKAEGHSIYLVGKSRNDISSSEYVYSYHGVKLSPAPYMDLEEEHAVQDAVRALITEGIISSAHDCADGGLFVTLLESAMVNGIGFSIETDAEIRTDAFLFGEAQSRVVVSVTPEKEEALAELLAAAGVEFSLLGETGGKDVLIDDQNFGSVAELKNLYDTALEKYLS